MPPPIPAKGCRGVTHRDALVCPGVSPNQSRGSEENPHPTVISKRITRFLQPLWQNHTWPVASGVHGTTHQDRQHASLLGCLSVLQTLALHR